MDFFFSAICANGLLFLWIGLEILLIIHGRQQIRKLAQQNGWMIEKISYNFRPRFLQGHYFNVVYRDEKGHEHNRSCQTTLLSGIKWDV